MLLGFIIMKINKKWGRNFKQRGGSYLDLGFLSRSRSFNYFTLVQVGNDQTKKMNLDWVLRFSLVFLFLFFFVFYFFFVRQKGLAGEWRYCPSPHVASALTRAAFGYRGAVAGRSCTRVLFLLFRSTGPGLHYRTTTSRGRWLDTQRELYQYI